MVEHNIDWDDEEEHDIVGTLFPSADPPCKVCKSPDHGHLDMGEYQIACPNQVKFEDGVIYGEALVTPPRLIDHISMSFSVKGDIPE